jgi:hypothetical protein
MSSETFSSLIPRSSETTWPGEILEHRLAAIAEARRLDGGDLEPAAQLVDHQRGQGLALDVLGDDQQRPARLNHGFEQRQHGLQVGELLLVQQDERLLELADHLVGVGDEVGREIAAVELHALDEVEFGVQRFGFLDRDHALVADLLHRLGQHPPDFGIAVRGDGADLGDLLRGRDLARAGMQIGDDGLDRHVDAALEIQGVHAGGVGLAAFADDDLGQHGGRRGAVTDQIAGLRGDLADHLGAHVLELVGQLDLLGDADAVLGDARRAEGLVEDDVASLRAEGHLDRVGQDVDPGQHAVARVGGKSYLFGSHR